MRTNITSVADCKAFCPEYPTCQNIERGKKEELTAPCTSMPEETKPDELLKDLEELFTSKE